MTAGRRNMWVNPFATDVTYIDLRAEVKPDLVADSTSTPFHDGEFDMVVFDPPHGSIGAAAMMAKRYGAIKTAEVRTLIERTGREAHRVTRSDGLMVLKWSDREMSINQIVPLLPSWEPLFGHAFATHNSRNAHTHWLLLRRRPS